jgi:hypothetical protein
VQVAPTSTLNVRGGERVVGDLDQLLRDRDESPGSRAAE